MGQQRLLIWKLQFPQFLRLGKLLSCQRVIIILVKGLENLKTLHKGEGQLQLKSTMKGILFGTRRIHKEAWVSLCQGCWAGDHDSGSGSCWTSWPLRPVSTPGAIVSHTGCDKSSHCACIFCSAQGREEAEPSLARGQRSFHPHHLQRPLPEIQATRQDQLHSSWDLVQNAMWSPWFKNLKFFKMGNNRAFNQVQVTGL